MDITNISCTPISPKSVSFGDSESFEEQAVAKDIPTDDFTPSKMTEDEKLAALNSAYTEIKGKQTDSKLAKALGNIATLGLTAASFAVVGTRLVKKLLPEVKVTKLVQQLQESIISDKGIKFAEGLNATAAKIASHIKHPKLAGLAGAIQGAPGKVIDAVFNFDLDKTPKIFTRASQLATGAVGVAVAAKDKDGDGKSDLREKAVGTFKAADAIGSVLLAGG